MYNTHKYTSSQCTRSYLVCGVLRSGTKEDDAGCSEEWDNLEAGEWSSGFNSTHNNRQSSGRKEESQKLSIVFMSRGRRVCVCGIRKVF
ncbi:hypothetical protein DMENIID0001_107280 [Sergentomyia squamirostris]